MLCSLISFLSFFLTICEMHGILFLFNIIRITLVSMFACQVHDEVILEGPSLAKAMSKPFYGTNILKERKKRYNARKVQRNRVSFPPTRPTTPPTRKKQKAKSKQSPRQRRQQQHPPTLPSSIPDSSSLSRAIAVHRALMSSSPCGCQCLAMTMRPATAVFSC